MTAPFGRRLCEVTENRASGGYRLFSLLDEEGPEPEPGQFYMLATEEPLGAAQPAPLPTSSPLGSGDRPAATSPLLADTAKKGEVAEARLPDRGGGAGHRSALRAGGRGAGLGERPARQLLLGSARAFPGRRRCDPGRRRDRHRPAGAAPPCLRRERTSQPGSCSASATNPTPAASTTSSPAARSASPATTATSGTTAT